MTKPFIKVIQSGGYDFGEPVAQLIKVASTGLRGHDLKTLIKRAGTRFADEVARADLKPGDVPVHLLAMGATEYYGPNRNGDGFKAASCRKYHDTFRKFARWYRHHQNKNPERSYGYVKMSAYNNRMHRIELLAILNSTKEAAHRNGGLVADEEMEKLAAGDDIPVSMACKVPFDVCSSCGNKARNREEYCRGMDEGGLCPGGGLWSKIATVIDDPHNPILHADNPDPMFFDISRVIKPADRIAYTLGQVKTAGAAILGGAALAEVLGVTAPTDLAATGATAEMVKLARRLAGIEASIEQDGFDRWALAFVEKAAWADSGARLGDTLQALAREKIILPVEGFLQLVGRDATKAAAAAPAVRAQLPGIYGRLLDTGELYPLLEASPFIPAEALAPLAVRRWAQKQASALSLGRAAVEDRILRASLYHDLPSPRRVSSGLLKIAEASRETAKHYAAYTLAALDTIRRTDQDLDLTLRLCVVQNYL